MAKSLNRVELLGHLGRDAERRTTSDGTPVARLSVATDYPVKDGRGGWSERTDWHDVVIWGAGKGLGALLRQGTRVYLSGRLRTRSWEKDGEQRYRTEVVCEAAGVIVLTTRPEGGGDPPDDPRSVEGRDETPV